MNLSPDDVVIFFFVLALVFELMRMSKRSGLGGPFEP